jgi:hypothetical protein
MPLRGQVWSHGFWQPKKSSSLAKSFINQFVLNSIVATIF